VRYENDDILGLIDEMAGLIRRALERMQSGDAEPYALANQAIGLALGTTPDLVSNMSPQGLASMLEMSNIDDRVLLLLSDALEIESEVCEVGGLLMEARLRAEQAAAVRRLLDPDRAN